MTEIVYVDTCIYMDLFKSGRANKWVNFYEVAFDFFKRLENGNYILVVSDWLKEQLRRNGVIAEAEELFKKFADKNKISYVFNTKDILAEANKYSNWEDAVHAIIAIRNKTEFFITRNFHHFEPFQFKLKFEQPEAFG